MSIERERRRYRPRLTGEERGQLVTRIPEYRPGCHVLLSLAAPEGLAGRVLQVRQLSCTITETTDGPAPWRVHFGDGRCCHVRYVVRLATEAEVARVRRMA